MNELGYFADKESMQKIIERNFKLQQLLTELRKERDHQKERDNSSDWTNKYIKNLNSTIHCIEQEIHSNRIDLFTLIDKERTKKDEYVVTIKEENAEGVTITGNPVFKVIKDIDISQMVGINMQIKTNNFEFIDKLLQYAHLYMEERKNNERE